jgi:4-aminobutyrate aminotransferase-like enzyme
MNPLKVKNNYEQFILKPVVNRIVIQKGKGVKLFDASGKEYFDFTSGGGISLLGYDNEYTAYVREAVEKQIQRMTHIPHYIYYSEPAAALAEKLAEITPGSLKKMFFCNSGSEAVEGAIRIVRKYKGKFELIGLQQGFMGRTMGAVSLTGISKAKKKIGPLLPGVYHIPAPYCMRCSLRHSYPDCEIACAEYLEDFLEYATCDDVAALFVEPALGDAGVIFPPEGYFQKLSSICKNHDICLVVDETLTGFGRTGKMFAIEHWDVKPEIMTLGKSIGGGFPLGAFIVTDRVAEVFEYDDFSSTAGGNPVACAAGLATIEIIQKEDLHVKAGILGDYLIDELKNLASVFPVMGDVRGKGLFVGIEIVEGGSNCPAFEKVKEIKRLMVENGFLIDIFGRSSLRLTPPLIINRETIDRFVETLGIVLKKVISH